MNTPLQQTAAPARNRAWAVRQLQRQLERDSWPRLQMLLLVALTGGTGFLASFALLGAGVQAMWLRYPLAVGIAYLAFLLLLWLWLRTRAEDYADVPGNLPSGGTSPAAHATPAPHSGGGGDFAGGGASASFDAHPASLAPDLPTPAAPHPLGDGLSTVAEADEFAVPVALALLVLGLALSSLYVVYMAPLLMAELLLDGVLAATLYRRLRGLQTQHWLQTALQRTAWPFALTALLLGAVGAAFQWLAPHALSLGGVLRHLAATS